MSFSIHKLFTVDPKVPGVAFQWIRMSPEGYVELPGATNQSFVVGSVRIDDAGWYACKLSAGDRTEFSKAVSLCVAVVPDRSSKAERKSTLSSSVEVAGNAVATLSTNDTVVIYAVPAPSVSTGTGCPGSYVGYANYTLPSAQGWGWAPSTNTTLHVARDITRTDTKIVYYGKYYDSGCAVGLVTINPTYSPKYRSRSISATACHRQVIRYSWKVSSLSLRSFGAPELVLRPARDFFWNRRRRAAVSPPYQRKRINSWYGVLPYFFFESLKDSRNPHVLRT